MAKAISPSVYHPSIGRLAYQRKTKPAEVSKVKAWGNKIMNKSRSEIVDAPIVPLVLQDMFDTVSLGRVYPKHA